MAAEQVVSLNVENMSCASCAGRVERALNAMDGVKDASVNLANETATFSIASPDLLQGVNTRLTALGYPAHSVKKTFYVDAMSCASCAGRVEKALLSVPGVQTAHVNLAKDTVEVTFLERVVETHAIARAAQEAGYPARLKDAEEEHVQVARKFEETRALKGQLAGAAALALPVFIIEMGAHLVPPFHHWIMATIGQQTSWLLQFALTTLIIVGPGRGFYVSGVPALFKGAPDMNSLVAVGTLAAYIYSVIATFLPHAIPEDVRSVYFEAAAVIIVLVLLGRYLEARAKGRTGAAIRSLLGLQAKSARVVREGTTLEVLLNEVLVADILEVRPGERIAADGTVIDGRSHVDESMITGEPIPSEKSSGSQVTGGTVNSTGHLKVRVDRTGADTTLAQIIRMVEDAQCAKLPIQALVDWITLWFVPAVMAAALLTFVVWLVLGPEPSLTHALVAGVSVLIIACPCAMGLATPTSIMVGTGRGAELGVLFRKGDALQQLAEADLIAFDKTGTITEGRPFLTDIVLLGDMDRSTVLQLSASLENLSEHPIAAAIVEKARSEALALETASDFQSLTGQGVSGVVGGNRVLVGTRRYLEAKDIDGSNAKEMEINLSRSGKTPLFVAIDGKLVALMAISDPIKASSVVALQKLKSAGLGLVMITGDKKETAETIAAETGIKTVVSEVLPSGKASTVEDLKRDGTKVVFVGDGINDAPALARADVGIAIGTGTDVAIEAADIVLISGDLVGVVNALEVSRRTMRNIRENLFWAFAYNTALIPVAAGLFYPLFGVLLSPILAAGAMALSSVFVLSNALRLRRVEPVFADKPAYRRSDDSGQLLPAE